MATVLRTPFFQASPATCISGIISSSSSKSASKSASKPSFVTFKYCGSNNCSSSSGHSRIPCLAFSNAPSLRFRNFLPFASSGETETAETEEVLASEVQNSSDGDIVEDGASDDVNDETSNDEAVNTEDVPPSVIITALQSYKEALANNDESRIAEIESFLKSIEDEKSILEQKVASLTAELSVERERILRISADFDNFRKRTERERLSLVTNAQGEVVESLLPVLDNFERAKGQIKVETEGEEKIKNSYQSIYKQFIEILGSLGVVSVETVGKPFDPLLHEAIMREDSAEFEEGIVLEEFRKGFKLGDRLLRPSMVKVSAGPGPTKSEEIAQPEQDTSETAEGTPEAESS